MKRSNSRDAFTLIELIIVIAIIAIIVAAVFVAMDPTKRLNRSHNARRAQDVDAIARALRLFTTDYAINPAAFAAPLNPTGGKYIRIGQDLSGYVSDNAPPCTSACGPAGQTVAPGSCIDASIIDSLYLSGPGYLPRVPADPATGRTADYAVLIETGGIIRARACQSSGEGAGGGGTPPLIEAVL